ncbi:FAD/NAD(P)-binding domain-containing protein [Zopfia rhizophila CBS 207.26]|uniref:FAD/NAD(P)-binding domain-containing protein n=1 Tax=Zopfia rhizophila CBS 207.26 TaxID=1314779 RepID=A0A6A6D4U6_9PEZI|nr:FAD/NAD(P)-binding domain-containing protein [Zopfia rhizophila CBS 207.26]
MKGLEIIIVGAGIGGLSAALALARDGHHVTVIDAIERFAEVGAGIRVPPNSSRLLVDWGVDLDNIPKVVSNGNRFVDWRNKPLLEISYKDLEARYGRPYYLIHRADLVEGLLRAVHRNPLIALKTGRKVIEYDFVVLGRPGIKSQIRSVVHGADISVRDTGDVAYRILVPTQPLLNDPETRHLVEEPWATHWLGPEGHAVGYPLRGGNQYNIIIDITHRTDLGALIGDSEWAKSADNTEIVKRFQDWHPVVRKLCSLTGQYVKWKLVDLEKPLQRWVHPAGKVVLLGDACHPMMPYLAQGAAQAIEDAGTLQASIAKYDSFSDALRAYERQRAPRAEYIVRNTRVLQEWLHLYDGPAREQRDELMRHDHPSNPIFWAYSPRMDWLFGYDAGVIEEDPPSLPELPPFPPREASVYKSTL